MTKLDCETNASGQARLLEYFGLREQPFGVTPDPRYLYFSPSHAEAFASLIYAIEAKRGFSTLIAEPGMGKTSLLFHLLEKMQHTARTAFLFQPEPDQHGLLRSLLADLGINTELQSVSEMHEVLNELLLVESRSGKHFVLVIDEAQDLDDSVLESVRLLSNFETPQAKLMHIVLAGQPALANRLARPELTQLRQRIAAWAGLSPLSASECGDYIDHRLNVAGHKGASLFPAASKLLITSVSRGLPRNINHICFGCLSLGFANQEKQMHAGIVREVLRDQEFAVAEGEERISVKSAPRPTETPYLPPIPNLPDYQGSRSVGGVLLSLIAIPLLLVFLASQFKSDYFSPKPGSGENSGTARSGTPTSSITNDIGYLPLPVAPSIDLAARTPTLAPDVAAAQQPVQAHVRHVATRSRPISQATPSRKTSSRVVVVRKEETLFQLALENYGKANWQIIGQIRANNSNIKDSFAYLRPGQRVLLPDLAPQFPLKNGSYSTASARP
ncbi:MAG TPA: AAA family ATPase [Candidatus Limnocylindrales bacterium]|nr:AAA family ATPase [Candidatus Limnocylindrales bacterium]